MLMMLGFPSLAAAATVHIAEPTSTAAAIRVQVFDGTRPAGGPPPAISFPSNQPYSLLPGVTTFRGGPNRSSAAFGATALTSATLEIAWRYRTGKSHWGGGAAWTGQPAVVRWPDALRRKMALKPGMAGRDGLVEVIQASPSGHLHFLDLATGRPTRDPIYVRNPIKGSVTVDPRGLPIVYTGEGIRENGPMALNAFNLLDSSLLWRLPGLDPNAPKGWDAMDGAPLIDRHNDTLLQTAENGLLYLLKLNTEWDAATGRLSQRPKPWKYRYEARGARRGGIEGSVAADANLAWFADNGGVVQCVDLRGLQPVWSNFLGDDSDATVVVDREGGRTVVYAGCEVDQQGTGGLARVRRLDGIDGTVAWEREFPCRSVLGERPVNGGMLATPAVGRHLVGDLLFLSIARYKSLTDGLLLAVDKRSGQTIWERRTKDFSWSSPVDFYSKDGTGFLLHGDSGGNLWLLEAGSGEVLSRARLGGIIEASPVFFEDMVVVGTRSNEIVGLRVK